MAFIDPTAPVLIRDHSSISALSDAIPVHRTARAKFSVLLRMKMLITGN